MNRISISILLTAGLALPTGCANKKKQDSENPESAAGAGDSDAPQANNSRGSTSTRGVGPRGGGRIKKFKAPKPARVAPTDSQKPGATETTEIVVTGLVPTMGAPGTVVEIFGSGFVDGVSVATGEATWEVVEVLDDRVVARVPEGAGGELSVSSGKASGTAASPFTAIDGGGFGVPATTLNGLIGTVSALADGGDASAGASPVGTIAAPNLAVSIEEGAQFGLTDYAITFDGSLNVTTEGEYDLCVTSDDGASLFVMDTLVIENKGEQEATQACELVYLEVGEYDLRVEYQNLAATPAAALMLEWSGPGGDLQPIPSEALFRPQR